MEPYRPSPRRIPRPYRYLALSAALILSGCASPGPPHPPSLHLPQPVRDLTALRTGNRVVLRFTVPSNSNDKLPLRGPTLPAQLCRQLPHQPCLPIASQSLPIANSNHTHNLATWTDTLPTSLTSAPPQLLTYRVEFFSPTHHSAGSSNQALTASGPAPDPVENLHAQGSRLGTILTWSPSQSPGDVLLQREDLAPAKPRQATPVWLQTNDSKGLTTTLDTTALPEIPYGYLAQRRSTLHLAGHAIELRSDLSAPITYTLQRLYPPPAPTGLTAAGYFTGSPSTFAVDLIWEPVDVTGLITILSGYNVYREPLDATGNPTAPRTQLTPTPTLQPAFHDSSAKSSISYRYSVTAVDAKGNQSPATTVILSPTP